MLLFILTFWNLCFLVCYCCFLMYFSLLVHHIFISFYCYDFIIYCNLLDFLNSIDVNWYSYYNFLLIYSLFFFHVFIFTLIIDSYFLDFYLLTYLFFYVFLLLIDYIYIYFYYYFYYLLLIYWILLILFILIDIVIISS